MGELIVNKIPLIFVPEIYLDRFVEDIINSYMEVAQQPAVTIPPIPDIMFGTTSPVFQAAGIMAFEYEDDDKFSSMLKESDEDEVDLALDIIEDFTNWENLNYYVNMGYEGMYGEDVMTILNFHHMCFADVHTNSFTGERSAWLMNEPIIAVW